MIIFLRFVLFHTFAFAFAAISAGGPRSTGGPHSFRAYLWLSHRSTVTPIIVECLFNCQDLFAKFFRFLAKYFSCLLRPFRVKILGAAPSSKNRASPRESMHARRGSVFIDKCNLISLFYDAWKYRLRYFRNIDKSTLRSACHAWQACVQRNRRFRFAHFCLVMRQKHLAEYHSVMGDISA